MSGNNIWDKNGSPYVVIGNTTFGSGSTLKILPGTIVKVTPGINFVIQGKLDVQGAIGDSVIFTSATTGPWQGLYFPSSYNDTISVRHTVIQNASPFMMFATGAGGKAIISNCRIVDVNKIIGTGGGNYVTVATAIDSSVVTNCQGPFSVGLLRSLVITNNFVTNCSGPIISNWPGDNSNVIVNNTFYRNTGSLIQLDDVYGSVSIKNNLIIENSAGTDVLINHSRPSNSQYQNNIFTGNTYSMLFGFWLTGTPNAQVVNNNSFNDQSGYIIKTSVPVGRVSIDLSSNWWNTADTNMIRTRYIYDFNNDPSYYPVNIAPILYAPALNLVSQPKDITDIALFSDSTFSTPISSGVSLGSAIYIKVSGIDNNPLSNDQTSITINSTSDLIGIQIVLTETAKASGIFTGSTLLTNSTNPSKGSIKSTLGDVITIKADKNNISIKTIVIPPMPILVARQNLLSFPNTVKGDSASLVLTIKDSSLSPLSISAINKGTSYFSFVQATPVNINGNDSIQITVRFKPSILGTVTDTLKITSDGGNASVVLTGTSPYPVLVSSSSSLSYGTVARNSTKQLGIKISNTSINKLTVDSVYTKTSIFTVDKNNGSVGTDTLSLNVTFSPTAVGAFTDTLYLRNNSETALVKIPLGGMTPMPVLVARQNLLSFPNTVKGDSSSLVLTIKDSSLSPLSISAINQGTSYFSFLQTTPVSINGNDSLQITVRFKPSILGTVTDTLKITSDGGNASVVLTGTSPYPVLVSSSSSLSYGTVARNSTKQLGVKISNTSINKLTVDSIYTKTSIFTVDKNNGSVGTDTLSLNVTFSPTAVGAFTDTLYLRNNSETALVKIPLSGMTPSPQIVSAVNFLSFNSTVLKDSAVSNLIIRNTSITAAQISKVTVGSYFRITNDSLKTIDGMDSVILTLVYKPITYGIHSDTVKIESDGGNLNIPVDGSSPYPELLIPQSQIAFGSIGVYDSLKLQLYIKNKSINQLNIDSVYTNTVSFTAVLQKSNVTQIDSSQLIISFSTAKYGSLADTVYFKSNALVPLYKLPLSAFVPYPYLSVNKTLIDFGTVLKDSLKQLTVTLKDTSISRLTIDSILTKTKYFTATLSGTNKILTKKDSAIVLVEVKPDTVKQFVDTLYIYNSSQVNPFKIALSANGIKSGINADAGLIPDHYSLSQNFPNPFNPSTVIRYALPFDSKVLIKIYNVLGQDVKLLKDEIISAGNYEVQFNSSSLSSGVYFYRLSAESVDGTQKYSSIKKMLLLK